MQRDKGEVSKKNDTSMKVDQIMLSNGHKIPAIGFGCVAPFPVDENEVENVVKIAVDLGYRYFDCASAYCTEAAVGKAIKDKIKEGVVKREELFLVSKLWITNMNKDNVVRECKKSADTMGLDYFDTYFIHFPFSDPEGTDFVDTWKGMEKCLELSLTRAIGISNFNINQIERLLNNAVVKPIFHQIEAHINLNQKQMRDYCASKNIKIIAYSPLGAPARCSPWQRPKTDVVDVQVPEITQIAKKYGKSNYQIALRYLIDIDMIPIPKSGNKNHIRENIDLFDFKLTPEEIAIIDKLDCGLRTNLAYPYKNYAEYPFH